MEHQILVLLHTTAACIWIGGLLIASFGVLPKVIKTRDINPFLSFHRAFDGIAAIALFILIIAGFRLSMLFLPVSEWFTLQIKISWLIVLKLSLILLTALIAINMRYFIIPKLNDKKIGLLAAHIISLTIIALLMMTLGLSFRFNIL